LTTNRPKKTVVIVGGGPAGMMAATQMLSCNCTVVLVDQKAAIGRKFLVAGDGGFNLTHAEPLASFIEKYNNSWIKECVSRYSNSDFIQFLDEIGIPTIIGSSGKIFPDSAIKPIQVLNSWKAILTPKVNFKLGWRLVDFNAGSATFHVDSGVKTLRFDFLVLALGGKSWSVTGSDGRWLEILSKKQVQTVPFQAGNSGLELKNEWIAGSEGQVIKNVVVSSNGFSCHGDIVCSKYGLEGKPIYAVNRGVRMSETPQIQIDFKPQFSLDQVKQILHRSDTPSQGLKTLKLSQVAIRWIKQFVSKDVFTDSDCLARVVKAFEVPVTGFRPIDEVISTVGGVAVEEIDESGQLKKYPQVYCCGEMVDWDAPTGGYLIQGCVSSGWAVGSAIKSTLKSH
jgi:uncharacterized flavoprotein (TIGR03862 family)